MQDYNFERRHTREVNPIISLDFWLEVPSSPGTRMRSPDRMVVALNWKGRDLSPKLLKWLSCVEQNSIKGGLSQSQVPVNLAEGSLWDLGWGQGCVCTNWDSRGRKWCSDTKAVHSHWTLGHQPSPGGATSLNTPSLQLRPQEGHAFRVRTTAQSEGKFRIKMHSNNRSNRQKGSAGNVIAWQSES